MVKRILLSIVMLVLIAYLAVAITLLVTPGIGASRAG